jgi:DNA-directed RNA polymerase specialized sigma24 family protein
MSQTFTDRANYYDDFADMVQLISNEFARRFTVVEVEDLKQELWLWFATHPNKVLEWSMLEQQDYDKLVAKSLRNAALKYCMKEKAIKAGYRVSDNYFYDSVMVEMFLPNIINESYEVPEAITDLNVSLGKSDLSEGNNWIAIRADISKAYESISERYQNVLRLKYSEKDFGRVLGISDDAARKRVERAINALIRKIGGWRPYPDSDYGNAEVSPESEE